VNWAAGTTLPNRVIVGLGTGGKVTIYNGQGAADAVIDVSGYFTDSTASGKFFTPLTPSRVVDTRVSGGTIGPNGIDTFQVTGGSVPAGATAVFINTTVTNTTASSALTVFPGPSRPTASDLNWVANQTIPNATLATLSSTGTSSFYNFVGSTDLVLDLSGYFGGGGGVTVTATPGSLPADGSSSSMVNTTVTDSSGNPIALDPVSYALVPSVTTGATSCGTLVPNSGTTNGAGVMPTSTYTATTVVGTCTITATEALHATHGAVTITQAALKNTISFTAPAAPIHVDADGVSTLSFSTTTSNPVTGHVGAGDMLTFTTSASTAGSCGAIGTISGTPAGATDASGVVTFVYTASATVGFCTITATEAATGGTKSAVVTQNVPGSFGVNGSAMTTSTTGITCTGTAIGSNICINANGKDTVAVKDTVTGPSQNLDAVLFSMAGAACGTLSPTSGTTTSLGVVNTTYTASTTTGKCTITASEANSGTSATFVIGQDVVAHTIVVTANPQNVVANGTSTSALTVTVTDGVSGAAVSGAAVAFATSGTCGAISGSSSPSNASGQVTATYTSTAISGFCTVTASDASGGSGKVRIDQTKPGTSTLTITAVATPTSVPADGTTGVSVKATVTAAGTPISGDPVQFTFAESAAGTCITTTPLTGNTAPDGTITLSYAATTVVGTCTITVTEANSGSSATATVTQTPVLNAVGVSVVSPQTIGGAQTAVVATVTHLGAPVHNDAVTFTTVGNPSGACGILSATSGNTGAGNTVTVNYAPSATSGFCTITATEAASSGSGSATITQTQSPASTNTVAVTDNKLGTLVADGSSTATITATIAGTDTVADEVHFTLSPSVPGACGTIASVYGNTGTGTTVTATYTASTTVGTCTITATEANGNAIGTDAIAQTQRPNNITLGASTTTVSTSGGGTSTLTVTVTDANTGTGINGDAITFTLTASVPGSCGTLSPVSGSTNTSGVFTTTYTTSATIGSCSITAHEAATLQSSSPVVIVQTA
jgi:adhesin/invasin